MPNFGEILYSSRRCNMKSYDASNISNLLDNLVGIKDAFSEITYNYLYTFFVWDNSLTTHLQRNATFLKPDTQKDDHDCQEHDLDFRALIFLRYFDKS